MTIALVAETAAPARRATARSIDAAETAKLIRKRLKVAFPGTKFSVRTSRYSGGASIDVRWTDGPTDAMVSAVTKPYQGGGFDSSIDLAYSSEAYLTADGRAVFASTEGTEGSIGSVSAGRAWMPEPGCERVRFSVNFVFTTRQFSRRMCESALAAHGRKWGEDDVKDVKLTGSDRYGWSLDAADWANHQRVNQTLARRMIAGR